VIAFRIIAGVVLLSSFLVWLFNPHFDPLMESNTASVTKVYQWLRNIVFEVLGDLATGIINGIPWFPPSPWFTISPVVVDVMAFMKLFDPSWRASLGHGSEDFLRRAFIDFVAIMGGTIAFWTVAAVEVDWLTK